jgi:hypothetical protein
MYVNTKNIENVRLGKRRYFIVPDRAMEMLIRIYICANMYEGAIPTILKLKKSNIL